MTFGDAGGSLGELLDGAREVAAHEGRAGRRRRQEQRREGESLRGDLREARREAELIDVCEHGIEAGGERARHRRSGERQEEAQAE